MLSKTINKYMRMIGVFGELIHYISLIALFLIMVITVFNAFGRYLFQSPISGTVSFVELFLMMTLIWFTAIRVQSEESNIQLDIVAKDFESRTKTTIQLLYLPLVLGVFVVLFSAALNTTLARFSARAVTSGAIQFPTYVSWGILTAGIGGLCLVLLYQFIRNVYELLTGMI